MTLQQQTAIAAIKNGRTVRILLLSLVCTLLTFSLLFMLLFGCNFGGHGVLGSTTGYTLLDQFDNYITNMKSTALEGIIQVEKIYMLSDSNQVAPEPNQDLYRITQNPADLQPVLDAVQERLSGEDFLFKTDVQILKDSNVQYYMDDTIFAVSWKQVLNNVVYTFSEVKIEHPSQFRRFLSDGTYGSDKQYLTSQMAASVNAVVASAGDFYKYRPIGLVVYNGKVERLVGGHLDNCFIDTKGDLIFTRKNELTTMEELEQFVADRDIRFSLSFGPILIEDGKSCVKEPYPIGEIAGTFSRAALCQLGPLHYVVVTANSEGGYGDFPTLFNFAKVLIGVGIEKAYTLDGGQTATIVMNDQVFNRVSYGAERYISDIIYFATANPEAK